jgi:hypothetical protein
LIFDLEAADGYPLRGPHLWYPAGSYEATFNELFPAFRVFATGFAGGELRFGGAKLRPHRPYKVVRH